MTRRIASVSFLAAVTVSLGAASAGPPARGFDMKNGGTYTSGKWKYVLVVYAPGTRSERRHGRLFWGDKEVAVPEINDHYKTPWGRIYWVKGTPNSFGDNGWMPHRARGGPGHDRKGKLLPSPGPAGAKAGPLELGEAANGKTVRALVGRVIQVRLKGNPTTGYRWTLRRIDGAAIRQVGKEQYVPDAAPPGMVGRGGRFLFTFRAMRAGAATIRLEYARPWEKNKPPAKTFTLTVRVADRPVSPAGLAKERAKLLGSDPRSFTLHLFYFGDQDKPYYSLLLLGARPKVARPGSPAPPRDPFALKVHVPKRQVEKLLAHLSASGFLGRAADAQRGAIPPATGPCYLLRVTGGPAAGPLDLRGRFGWGPPMFQKLDALRAVLFAPAAEAMDTLLGRLAGHRKPAGAKPLSASDVRGRD